MDTEKTLGVAALEQSILPPYGKQRFFFEDMIQSCADLPLEFFFFSPLDWKAGQNEIPGYQFEAGVWIKTKKALPKLIYDRAFSREQSEKKQIRYFRKWLETAPHHTLNPVKFARLMDDKVAFHHYLQSQNLPTIETRDFDWLFTAADFEESTAFYIKPISGSGGTGIYVLEKNQGGFLLKNHVNSDFWQFESLQQTHSFLSKQIDSSQYFVQPRARVSTFEGRPYDVRVLVQNHGIKDYRITGLCLRLGPKDANVSNLEAGGMAAPFEILEKHYLAVCGKSISAEIDRLKTLALDCCYKLHDSFGNFLEIGLDFLLSTDAGPLILEGNTRPARWIFMSLADYFKDDSIQNQYYLDLRRLSVRIPGIFALSALGL